MRRHRATALLMTAALGGCGPDALVVPPAEPGVESVIVVVDDGVEIALRAFDAREPWRLDAGEGQQVTVLYYRRPLAELGLAAGAVERDTRGAPCTRLAPAAVWRSTEDGTFGAAVLDRALEEVLVVEGRARCGACRTFEEDRVTLPGVTPKLKVAAPLGDGRVLGVAPLGVVLAIDKRVPTVIEGGCGERNHFGIKALGNDEFLLGDGSGNLDHVAIDPRTERCRVLSTRTTTTGRPIIWIDGSPDGREIYTLDAFGSLHRAIGDGPLEPLLSVPIHERFRPEGSSRGGLAWLRPGEVVASASFPEVVWITDGRVSRSQPIEVGGPNVTLSELIAVDGDVYVGDGEGQVTRIPAATETPERLRGSPLQEIVGSLVPDRDGLIITSGSGEVAQYYPPLGFCPEVHSISGVSARGEHAYFDAAGELVLPNSVGGGGRAAEVVWLRSRELTAPR